MPHKRTIATAALALALSISAAANTPTPIVVTQPTAAPAAPSITPPAPSLNAKGFVLMDAASGKIIAQKNMHEKMQPASLTKMMTLYVISEQLKAGRIHLDDKVRISEKAWKTGGSKMFVKVGSDVPVSELIQGIIVDSGNDACTAMAEYIAGNENTFAALMNQAAKKLGMTNTHYVDSTGLPKPGHYSTPHDMAILARAITNDFPDDYHWYKQKWFTYNGIRQPNRNRLLWRGTIYDGIKTGHTKEAGYCLVSSAFNNNTRLISVIMGAKTDAERANDSQALLTYGFRFFESHQLFGANKTVTTARVWLGQTKQANLGLTEPLIVVIPSGQYSHLNASMTLNPRVTAPIQKGQQLGTVTVTLGGKDIATAPLVALQSDSQGGFWSRLTDRIHLFFKG